jgi:hypothetical protein
MLGCMGESEDAGGGGEAAEGADGRRPEPPATVRSVIRGCGESGSIVYVTIRPLADGDWPPMRGPATTARCRRE